MSSRLKIAAIRSGTEPVGPLPPAAFHRWLDQPIGCPRCSVQYHMVRGWDHTTSRFFERESQPLVRLLTKAVLMGHADNHRVSHFETAGVVVESITAPLR